MGCCLSSGAEESRPITAGSSASAPSGSTTANRKGKEDKIELAFKAKRANIFTEGVDFGRNAFSIKKVNKNAKQTQLIRKFTELKFFPPITMLTCQYFDLLSVCHRSKLHFCLA